MSKALIITVAGTSSRFRKSLNQDVLKAIYCENKMPTILDVILEYAKDIFEEVIIVGGYKFDALSTYINKSCLRKKITLVENKQFERGSNLSLILGIKSLEKEYDEVMFIEGDLLIDKESFLNIANNKENTISYTNIPIDAKKSVAYYINKNNKIVYIYDTQHEYLKIEEPFKSIYNSGQIWKFCNIELLKKVANSFNEDHLDLTNLATIESYFNQRKKIKHSLIKTWYNCNTIDDYQEATQFLKEKNEYNK